MISPIGVGWLLNLGAFFFCWVCNESVIEGIYHITLALDLIRFLIYFSIADIFRPYLIRFNERHAYSLISSECGRVDSEVYLDYISGIIHEVIPNDLELSQLS